MKKTPDPCAGFSYPEENWSKLPHQLIELLPAIATVAELKIVLYVLRHTWGYQEFDEGKRITFDEFAHGRKRRSGPRGAPSRIDGGTGLSVSAIQDGVRAALDHGLLIRESDGRDPATSSFTYRLHMLAAGAAPDAGDAAPAADADPEPEADPESPYRTSVPDQEPAYRTSVSEGGPAYRTSVTGIPNFGNRSGKDTLRETNPERYLAPADGGRAHLLSENPQIGGFGGGPDAIDPFDALFPARAAPVEMPPPFEIPEGMTAAEALRRRGPAAHARAMARAAALDDWEARRSVQAWGVKHPTAPLADIIALGRALERRVGMRPDWADAREVGSWLTGLHRALRAADSDVELVIDTALDMRHEGLAIVDPFSLVGMTRDAAARRRVPYNRGPAIQWLN